MLVFHLSRAVVGGAEAPTPKRSAGTHASAWPSAVRLGERGGAYSFSLQFSDFQSTCLAQCPISKQGSEARGALAFAPPIYHQSPTVDREFPLTSLMACPQHLAQCLALKRCSKYVEECNRDYHPRKCITSSLKSSHVSPWNSLFFCLFA